MAGINLRSDNVVGAAPAIAAAIQAVCTGSAPAYGDDAHTAAVEGQLREIFEHDRLLAFPVATGTAANALALATLCPPHGAVLCHEHAHINVDECGAPELYTGGAKLLALPGAGGKIAAADLAARLAAMPPGNVHAVQPAVLSLTQATEAGCVYRLEELRALGAVARQHDLRLHMDGARFANALVSLGCSPAEATWRAGVDVLSLGATKNGAMAAEVVVFFDPDLARDFIYRRKRGGHLVSKMRLVSAQLEAYFTDGLWLSLAAHANRMAGRLAEGLLALDGISLRDPVGANELFVRLPEPAIEPLLAMGHGFYRWDSEVCRLVTSFATTEADIDRFLADLAGVLKQSAA